MKVWVIAGSTFGSGCYWAPGPIDYVRDIKYAIKFADRESADEVRKTLFYAGTWHVVERETQSEEISRDG